MKSNETLNLIEEITRNDGSKYYEVSDIAQNGRAELAAIRGFIKSVRILPWRRIIPKAARWNRW